VTVIDSTWRPFDRPVPADDGCHPDPVGVLEMATRLDVKDRSIHMMRRRGRLPRPDYGDVNGSAAWDWRTILWWAGETGRLRTKALVSDYLFHFGENPPDPRSTRTPDGVTRLVDDTPATPPVPSVPKKTAARKRPAAKAARR
jgi:hypothetical protein